MGGMLFIMLLCGYCIFNFRIQMSLQNLHYAVATLLAVMATEDINHMSKKGERPVDLCAIGEKYAEIRQLFRDCPEVDKGAWL